MRINQILKIQLLLTSCLLGGFAQAADIQNGKTLHQAKCYQCHAEKSGLGNGDVIYTRLDRKAKDLAKVKSMVAMCNTELRLDLFPEDEADLVAYINQQFYKYK
jgi:cytochrome c2